MPNATLVKENAKIAELYKQKSVAEQNSVDLAWDMLMDSKYAALQGVLYTNASELERFRQLVVNVSFGSGWLANAAPIFSLTITTALFLSRFSP